MMPQRIYLSHASPVRAARLAARQKLPCPRCGGRGEPTVRRARPFSEEWRLQKDAYFGCSKCGLLLAELTGPAAMRPSDEPLDRVPDPEGTRARLLEDESFKRAVRDIRRDGGPLTGINLGHIHPGLVLRPDLTVTFESRLLLVIEPEY